VARGETATPPGPPALTGTLRTAADSWQPAASLDTFLTRCPEHVPAPEFYRRAEARGYTVDPRLRCISQLWCRDGHAVSLVRPGDLPDPVRLEAGLLTMFAAWPHAVGDETGAAFVPVSFDRVRLGVRVTAEMWVLAR